MHRYRSSSRFHVTEAVIGAAMLIGLGYFGVTATENVAVQISVAMVVFFITLWIVLSNRDRIIDVEFREQFIVVNHVFKVDVVRIPYEHVIELQFVSVNKGPTINKMKFDYLERQETIRFKTIAHGTEFVDFVKWLKTKNDKIKVTAYPPDHYMNHKLQEEYGFNYRKVPKID